MSIRFIRQKNELLLILTPETAEVQDILDNLENGKDWNIRHCFSVNKKHLKGKNLDENKLAFCVGTVQREYTKMDNNIIGTKHNFYFSNDIKLERRHFIAYRNISVLPKIDEVVDQDV